jgi:hypothetical protein
MENGKRNVGEITVSPGSVVVGVVTAAVPVEDVCVVREEGGR